MKALKNIDLFLLDLDGTIYHDNDLIDGSLDFINKLITENKKFVFLTNNSSISRDEYVDKLSRMGFTCTLENVLTAGTASAKFLSEKRTGKSIYFVGTKSFEQEILDYNIKIVQDNPDIVLVTHDKELTYEKLKKACTFIDNGAEFIASNPDYTCPTINNRFLPDCGLFCYMIEYATKKSPIIIGKPNTYMVDILSNKFNIPLNKIAIIGDRLDTDIKTGLNANITSVCVLTGEATPELIKKSNLKPSFVFNSIKDLINQL